MVDSIQLRVHDTRKHAEFIRNLKLLAKSKDKKSMSRHLKVVDLTPEAFERLKGKEVSLIKDWLHFEDGHEVTIYQRSKIELPSSHYGLVYQIKENFVEFSFSIPKALYGNNIAQFVTAPGAMNIGVEKHQMKYQSVMTYKRLVKFVKDFLNEVGQDAPFDWTEVELLSIDLCFNQIFDSEKDARCYIDWQKKIWKPRVRRESNMLRTFDTSISYVTEGYTCKIYHKGSEYKRHDAKRHHGINEDAKKKMLDEAKKRGIKLSQTELSRAKVFDIDALQALANRIVRYEVHYRKSELSRMAMNKEFRKNNKKFQNAHELYKMIRCATREGTRRNEEFRISWADFNNRSYPKRLRKHMDNMIHKRGVKLKEGMRYVSKKSDAPCVPRGMFVTDKKGMYVTIEYCTNKEWKFYHEFLNAIRKRRGIYFEVKPGDALWFAGGANCGFMKEIVPIKFTPELFLHIHRHFMNFMKSFQVKKMPDFEESMARIDAYNDEMKRERAYAKSVGNSTAKFQGINKNQMSSILKLADKHPWNDIPEILGLCPRTWRRWKAKLKKIGRTELNVGYGDMLKNISLDFTRYYEEADRMGKKLYVNQRGYYHE